MKRIVSALLSVLMVTTLMVGCGSAPEESTESATTEETTAVGTEDAGESDFSGQTLSILVNAGWMDAEFDYSSIVARFEEAYGVTVDIQSVPGDQYEDMMLTKLNTGTCADIFWMQSNPFAIESILVNYEEYCLDFTGAEWQSVIPEGRLASCMVGDSLYGLQLWHNSPEYVFVYNKTIFDELGIKEAPSTYDEFMAACKTISDAGITPWYMPGADGWRQQLPFFQIGPVYEANQPGLYEELNNNTATYAGNETMLLVLEQLKECSDLGYMGEDWIGTDSTNMQNAVADHEAAMVVANSSWIQQVRSETGTTDEFGLFLLPFADNDYFPTNPAGPTIFGYAGTKNEALVREFFDFLCTSESLQELVDNSPAYTNLDVMDESIVQHWLPEEETFMATIDQTKMNTAVLQTGTKYSNDFWYDFGVDFISYCQGTIEAADVLENMDANRATAAEIVGDENW